MTVSVGWTFMSTGKCIPDSVQGCILMSWERMDVRNDQAPDDTMGGGHKCPPYVL